MTPPIGCCYDDKRICKVHHQLRWRIPRTGDHCRMKKLFILSSTSVREVLSHYSILQMLLRRQEDLQSPPSTTMADSLVWGPLSHEQIIFKFILSSASIREVLSHHSIFRMLLRRQNQVYIFYQLLYWCIPDD